MTLERINPEELARPSGFSHAVRATGTVTVHLAGQTAMDTDGRIVGGGVVGQFEQALSNLLAALRAAGGGPEHLASLTIYIVDVPDYRAHAREIGRVWRRLAGTDYPATAGIGVARLGGGEPLVGGQGAAGSRAPAGIGVARLWDDDALVEVQGTAELPAQQ